MSRAFQDATDDVQHAEARALRAGLLHSTLLGDRYSASPCRLFCYNYIGNRRRRVHPCFVRTARASPSVGVSLSGWAQPDEYHSGTTNLSGGPGPRPPGRLPWLVGDPGANPRRAAVGAVWAQIGAGLELFAVSEGPMMVNDNVSLIACDLVRSLYVQSNLVRRPPRPR